MNTPCYGATIGIGAGTPNYRPMSCTHHGRQTFGHLYWQGQKWQTYVNGQYLDCDDLSVRVLNL